MKALSAYHHHIPFTLCAAMPTTNINVFQDLVIHGAGRTVPQIREVILTKITPPWLHERDREVETQKYDPGFPNTIAVSRGAQGEVPAIGLVLCATVDGYEVVNIVPQESGSIGIAVYNRVLNDFYRDVIEPAAEDQPWTIELTKAAQELEDWLGGPAAQALRTFSGAANKSTGASHPSDEKRWFKFLIAAHQSGRRAEAELLWRWLMEVERWPEREAHDLAADYETALSLLRFYDRQR